MGNFFQTTTLDPVTFEAPPEEQKRTTMSKMRCHYEVMDLPRDASQDEIKKQYKKLALKWHPDRNFGQEELATQTFKEISTAYSVLSDPHERKWYDDHRDAILRGKDFNGGGGDGDDDEDDIDSIINIWQYFNSSCYSDFDDSATGYYTVYRGVFEKIKSLEEEHRKDGEKLMSLPEFGSSLSNIADVLLFYACWENFITVVNFASHDKYNTLDAPNRMVKRAMEKENQKLRDAARREYIGRIKSLVAFVKKRDPRVAKYEQEKQLKKQEELQRKENEKKLQKQRRQEQRELWKQQYNQEEEETMRNQERKGAFLLADNDSDYDEINSNHMRADENEYTVDGSTEEEQLYAQVSKLNVTNEGDVQAESGKDSVPEHVFESVNKSTTSIGEDEDAAAEDAEDEEDGGVLYKCEACSKNFKTEAQLNQHLQSKVHRKKVQELQKQQSKGKKKT
jgi:DnaJ family protein A protein 5